MSPHSNPDEDLTAFESQLRSLVPRPARVAQLCLPVAEAPQPPADTLQTGVPGNSAVTLPRSVALRSMLLSAACGALAGAACTLLVVRWQGSNATSPPLSPASGILSPSRLEPAADSSPHTASLVVTADTSVPAATGQAQRLASTHHVSPWAELPPPPSRQSRILQPRDVQRDSHWLHGLLMPIGLPMDLDPGSGDLSTAHSAAANVHDRHDVPRNRPVSPPEHVMPQRQWMQRLLDSPELLF